MSIRLRLALFGLGVVTVTLLLFVIMFFALLTAGGSNTQDRELAERAQETVDAVAGAPREEFTPHSVIAPVDAAIQVDMFTLVLHSDGSPISATGSVQGAVPAVPSELLRQASVEGHASTTLEAAPGVRLRLHARPWSRPDLGLTGYAVAAQSTQRVENELRVGRVFVIAAAVFAFIVAALAIWLVLGRALRPLRQLASLTGEVGATQDLSRRLPVPRPRDEVRRLSESFNSMMARLEEAQQRLTNALESQQRFVADASHELRTPLTTIRSNADFLLQHPDAQADDRQAALSDIAAESGRMSRLVHDLLTLARADGGFHLEIAPVDLGALILEVARQASNLHPTRRLRANVAESRINGNSDALTQLLWILIDNAVLHTTEGGHIRLALEQKAGVVSLIVADDGDGIPDEALSRVFDRFYQADATRGRGGSGLGLSIARWLVHEHGGRISAHNNDHGGATIQVELPILEAEFFQAETSSQDDTRTPVKAPDPSLSHRDALAAEGEG